MSSVELKKSAPIVTWSERSEETFAAQLHAAGIVIPDQKRIKYLMRVQQLGFADGVSSWRLRFALWRWLVRDSWRPFAYEDYCRKAVYTLWGGGPVPDAVQQRVDQIRKAIPGVTFRVHALKEDPWLEAVSPRGEKLFIVGWVYAWEGTTLRRSILQ